MALIKNIILEIGTEEIPARFMTGETGAIATLKKKAEAAFEANRIGYKEARVYATPRRLVLALTDVEDMQKAIVELLKGPPFASAYDSEGNPTPAAIGFAKSKGIQVTDLREMEVKGVRYVAAEVREESRSTLDVLPELLKGLIASLSFPKSMYWSKPDVRFARPIRWILALADDQVIPFEYGNVTSGRLTTGHRFMGKRTIEINDAANFMQALYDNKVILDQNKRRQKMEAAISDLKREFEGNLDVEMDPEIIEENLYLVEYPVPFIGSFDSRYLEIPPEVLVTSMKKNQKYFAVRNLDKPIPGTNQSALANYFVGVSNNKALEMGVVREGNERVLRARLEDAAFFWNEDRKRPLSAYVDKLRDVTYLESVGSVYDKVMNTQKIAAWLCEELGKKELAPLVERAAYLSKADLTTSMVFEFTELQGVMGREYAKCSGEDPRVALAIYEHYLPRGANDATPTDDVGAILGIAERLYIITVCHKVGLEPTSTQDPYALRRAARGINEVLWARKLNLDITRAVEQACAVNEVSDEIKAKILTFMEQRLLIQLRERGFSHELATLALTVIAHIPNQALRFLETLNSVRTESWFTALASSAVRVRNILQKAGDIAVSEPDETLMSKDAERELAAATARIEPKVAADVANRRWSDLMQLLAELSPVVSKFFDDVMVMDKDPAVQTNRLALLARCNALFKEVGDLGAVKL